MPRDRLYRGSQLKEANTWAKRSVPSRQEVAFLRASAQRKVQFVASIIVIFLLLVSTAGVAIRFFLLLPPDPRLVTNLKDDGQGSLRWAIVTATDGSTITFDPSLGKSVILLTSKDLTFTKNMIIRGPGAQSLAISGGKSGHIVRVLPNVSVTIFDLSFKNSNTGKTGVGFIKNEGTLKLTNCTISGNTSLAAGGGIMNTSKGNLTLTNSTVSRNRSQYGGGIYNDSSGELTLIHSTISENVASQEGGGIFDYQDHDHQTSIISCTIRGNTAQDGGGIFVDGGHSIDARDTHITGNYAPKDPDTAGKIISSQ